MPVLLVVIACAQFYVANTSTLSPWKGGGFGMFATIDGSSMRSLSGVGKTAQGKTVSIDLLSSLSSPQRLAARIWPAAISLDDLADRALSVPVVPSDRKLEYLDEYGEVVASDPNANAIAYIEQLPPLYKMAPRADASGLDSERLVEITLQWRRLLFDPEQARLTSEPLGAPAIRSAKP